MPTDTTGLYYLCPFCNEPFPSARRVRRHVTQTDEGDHRNKNGFEMERTIVTTFNPYERLTMTQKIIEAGNKLGEPLTYENAEEVAERSEEPRNKILRIWKDNDFEIEGLSSKTTLDWDGLNEKQKDFLLYYYHNDSEEISPQQFALEAGYADTFTNIGRHISTHGWLLEDEFRPDWVDEAEDEYKLDTEKTNDQETTEKDNKENKIDSLETLDEVGIRYSAVINIKEDDFEAMKKLIEAGYSEVAEQIYEKDEVILSSLGEQ